MDNVETSIVSLTVSNDTNTTHVTTTGGHGNDTSIELDKVIDLASLEVDLDSVVDLDGWVWVTDTTEKDLSVLMKEGGIATVDAASINHVSQGGSTKAWTNG